MKDILPDQDGRRRTPTRYALAFGIGVAVSLVSAGLYGYQIGATPPGRIPLAIANPVDQFPQIGFIEQAAQGVPGQWDLFTFLDGQTWPVLRPSFMILGGLSRATGIEPRWMYHIGRLALIPVLAMVVLAVASQHLPERLGTPAVVLVFTSSGLGWLQSSYPTWDSTDHLVKESITFMAVHDAPHFVVSLILLLAVLAMHRSAIEDPRWIVPAGAALFLLGLEHPYDVVTILAVLGVESIHRWVGTRDRRPLIAAVSSFALASPAFLYVLASFHIDPVLSGWRQNNVMESTSLSSLISGMGLLLPLAAAGAARREGDSAGFLLRWALVQGLLCFAPLPFQRRLVFGLHVPLALLATLGVDHLLRAPGMPPRRTPTRRTVLWAAAIVLVLSLSNVRYVTYWVRTAGQPDDLRSVPADLWSLLGRLEIDSRFGDKVLANPLLSRIVTAFPARHVVWGDPYLTVVSPGIDRFLGRVAAGAPGVEEGLNFLRDHGVDFLLVDHEALAGLDRWLRESGVLDRTGTLARAGRYSLHRVGSGPGEEAVVRPDSADRAATDGAGAPGS